MLLSKAYNIENYNRSAASDGYIRPKLSHMYTSNSNTFKRVLPNFVTVGSGKQYSTITAGIAAANAGDIVFIYPGTYYEVITLNKAVHLRGVTDSVTTGEVTINSTGSSTIHVTAAGTDTIYLDNLYLVTSGSSMVVVALNNVVSNVNLIVNKCMLIANNSSSYSIGKSNNATDCSITVTNCYLRRGNAHLLRMSSADSVSATTFNNTWATYLGGTLKYLDVKAVGTANYGPAYGSTYFDDYLDAIS